MTITIEKYIPIPETPTSHTESAKDKLNTMKIGDSFTVPDVPAANYHSKLMRQLFGQFAHIRRVQPDGTYRIWRTA